MEQNNQKSIKATTKFLRTVGPLILLAGLVCMIVASVDFFTSVGMPTLFYLFFIGSPLLFIGIVMTVVGYMGSIHRYTASQVAPVSKDVINYMLDGTREAVGDVASTIMQAHAGSQNKIVCEHCHEEAQSNAKFCDHCGRPLFILCSNCLTKNETNARYCQNCGKSL